MTKYLIMTFILLTIASCGDHEQVIKEFYPSGNVRLEKHYDKGNWLEQTLNFYDAPGSKIFKSIYHKVDFDSVVYYYDNGKIFKTGLQDKTGKSFGKWNYYTREGFLSNTKEFFIVNNSFGKGDILNQVWYYDRKGDTMFYGNNKFNIFKQKEFEGESAGEKTSIFVRFFYDPSGDTLSIAQPLKGIAEDGYPFWEKKNSESYIVLAKEKFNFNKDFSNEKEVKLDTFYCLEKDKVNKGVMAKANQRHTVVFGRWFDTPGKKILRGYMVEEYKRKSTTDDSIVRKTRRTYFEKEIFVKDTVD